MGATLSQEEYKHHVKAVWHATAMLAAVTIVEVGGALIYPHHYPKLPLNIFFIVMSLMKAYYIVAVFMHMKYEDKILRYLILLPTLFLLWAIIAFLWDGWSWMLMRIG